MSQDNFYREICSLKYQIEQLKKMYYEKFSASTPSLENVMQRNNLTTYDYYGNNIELKGNVKLLNFDRTVATTYDLGNIKWGNVETPYVLSFPTKSGRVVTSINNVEPSIDGNVTLATTTSYSNIYTAVAGETINGGKAVIIEEDGKAYIYDIGNESHYGKTVGISKTSAIIGHAVDIFVEGIAYEAGSNWQAGRTYYVGNTGTLTDVLPTLGLIKVIGIGIETDKILINNNLEIITI